MNDIRDSLRALYNEGRSFDNRDPLVNLERNRSKLFQHDVIQEEISLGLFPPKIITDAKAHLKETGSNPLCYVKQVIRVREDRSFPFTLIPTTYTINKLTNSISFTAENELLINPYLSLFLENAGVSIPDQLSGLFFNNQLNEEELGLINDFLIQKGLQIENVGFIVGNFHPHRFSYLKDIDRLLRTDVNDRLSQLLTGEINEELSFKLTPKNLYPADNDQLNAFGTFESANTSLLGPPGTGKSQFLTNLIGKSVFSGYSVLAISEKRTALEVIQKRLSERNLDNFCFIYSGGKDNSKFIAQLKDNWKTLESLTIKPSVNLERSSDLLNNLQFTLDILKSPGVIGGLSLEDYFARFPSNIESDKYISKAPAITEWIIKSDSIKKVFSIKGISCIEFIPHEVFKSLTFTTYLKELNELNQLFQQLQTLHSFDTKKELEAFILKLSYAQITQNDFFRKHAPIFIPDSKEQKAFLRFAKKITQLSNEIDNGDSFQHWKYIPNTKELEVILADLNSGKGMTWNKKRQWSKRSKAPFSAAKDLLSDELHLRSLELEKQQITDKLHDLGVELSEISLTLEWIKRYKAEEWKTIHAFSKELQVYPKNAHLDLDQLTKQLQKLLILNTETSITEAISTIIRKSSSLSEIWNEISDWSEALLNARNNASSFEELEKLVLHSNWIDFSSKYPGLRHFHPSSLKERIEEIIREQNLEFEQFATEIKLTQKKAFDELEALLQTPARKLSETEKQRKQQLRKGKAMLTREFSKKTRHTSLYNLYHSEARLWLQILIPVLMCNTEEVANCFPLEADLFDVVVFDEASQIPLFAALGGIQRSKRYIIAGDDQQMRPVKAFSSRSEEIRDLLTQGLLYLKNGMLKHHYRSYNEHLIAFSNTHFYKNELIAFPAFPPDNEALKKINVGGIYSERKNKKEAEAISHRISELLKGDMHFGIVAFSEEQTNLIRSNLSASDQEKLNEAIDHNRAFLKPVEKVQGDECDTLLISFTFARNPEGKFKYTFGPMSTTHGTNRLNVLLTRARKKIEFYTSVDHKDFRISNNESVEMIRKWFLFLESSSQDETIRFPYDLTPEISGNKLKIKEASRSVSNAIELCTLHAVLSDRGWDVNYV